MMRRPRPLWLILLLLCAWALPCFGQAVNSAQQLVFAGLRSSGMQGQINAVATDSSGDLYLLLDQKDGVRLLKTDGNAGQLLAQAQVGAAGDVGVAMTLDPSGQVLVTGTSTSTSLQATTEAAIPQRSGSTSNSFVAGFDSSLNLRFLTFTGGSRSAASAIAATSDAVFVTGLLYGADLPVTSNGIQQAPASGSFGNGFVERFNSSGTTLVYATYLTGTGGDTAPAALAADEADEAIVAGSTTASGYPTVAALVPAMLSDPSGFLTKLTAAGDGIRFSTFIPGSGLTSLALDSTGSVLLASGTVNAGQFPVATVATPLLPLSTQVLLRLPLDGSSVLSSVAVAPGTQSHVAAGPNAAAWVSGLTSLPLLPGTPLAGLGQGFSVRVSSGDAIDQSARFGGQPELNPSFSSLPLRLTSGAVDAVGNLLVAGAVLPTASSSLLGSQTYDLPLLNTPTPALPSGLRAAEQSAASCTGSLCAGSAAYLAKLSPSGTAAALAVSIDDAPEVTIRNLGAASATGLTLTSSAGPVQTTCGSSLPAGGECVALLPGTSASTLTVSAANGGTQQVIVPAALASPAPLAIVPRELDFGLVASSGSAGSRTLTITNLGSATQTFTSALDSSSTSGSPFAELSSDCATSGAVTRKVLAAGASCHIQIGLTASSTSSGIVTADWLVGNRDVLLTGYSLAGTLVLSASELDFGTEYTNGLRLPRYLFLTNASSGAVSHTTATLPAGSPFTVTDGCPSTLAAGSTCRMRVDYLSSTAPSKDSATLELDEGLSVLLTGQTLPPKTATGSTVNPNLSVTPTSLTFSNAVAVTSVSSTTQSVSITNTGASPFALSLTLSGDFTDVTSCGATLGGGQTCAVAISFAPSQPGPRTGMLAVTAGAGSSPAVVQLAGTGSAILAANNGTLDFGSVPVGQPRVQFYKVQQPFSTLTVSTTGPYAVTLVEDIGYGYGHPSASAFAASLQSSCANCYLAIQFLPAAAGSQPGTVTLSSTAGGTSYQLAPTGVGLPTSGLLLTPPVQDFGTVPVNSTSSPALFTLTNLVPGGVPVMVTAPALSGDFSTVNTATGGQACGGALAYGASCFVPVAFSPIATGARSGSLTLATAGGSVSAVLTGFASADPGVALRPLSVVFNNVPGASSTQQTVTLLNTGSSALQVGTPSVATSAFTVQSGCGTVAPQASCSIQVNYLPGSATSSDTLTIPVISLTAGGNAELTSYAVALSGAYTAANSGLEIVPGQVLYGPEATSTASAARQFTVNNLSAQPVSLAVTIPRNFALTGTPCTALPAAGTCSFSVEFTPLTASDQTGTLYATGTPSNGGSSLAGLAYVSGYGTASGSLKIGPLQSGNLFPFGQVASGQSASQKLTLTNSGSTSVTVRRVASPPPFLTTSTCGGAMSPGQSCVVTVTYSPQNQVATGTNSPASTFDTGLLTIESDAASSPDLINLTGQGGPVAVSSPSNQTPIALYSLSQTSLTFPSVAVGNASATQTVTLTNTGSAILHVLSATSTADFTVTSNCGTLLAASTCTLTVASTPQTAGSHLAALSISTDSATSLEFVSLISGSTAAGLTISPTSLAFGSVQVGSPASLPVTVTNPSGSAVVFSGISVSGDYAATGTCPAAGSSLPAGASCTLQVTFTPSTTGLRSGTLSIASSASTLPLTVSLSGTGVDSRLQASPASLQFGSIAVGASANLSLTLTNSGTAPLTGLNLSTGGDYTVTVPCPSNTLNPGDVCTAQVTFTPTVTGPRPGSLLVTSSDKSSPLTVSLSGSGVQGGGFLLTVNGASSAAATVQTASPGSFPLLLTPTGGFTGTVALTCAAVTGGPYMSCSLEPSTLTLAGSSLSATATLTTIATAADRRPVFPFDPSRQDAAWCALVPLAFLARWRRLRLPRAFHALGPLSMLWVLILMTGCGSSSHIHFTPPGTYQYRVTASSTTGVVTSQAVTLNITVQ